MIGHIASNKNPECFYDPSIDGDLPPVPQFRRDITVTSVDYNIDVDYRTFGKTLLYPALNEVEAYDRVEQTAHVGWNDLWIEQDGCILTLPGRGEPGPACGEWRYAAKCSNPLDAKAQMRGHVYSCHRPVCPECLYSAAHQKATDIWKIFQGKALVLQAEAALKKRTIGSKKHFMFALPPDLFTPDELLDKQFMKRLEKELDTIMEEAFQDGWFAGFVVFHSHRLQRPDGSYIGEDELEKFDSPNDINLRDMFQGCVPVWGPHWHFVGYGYLMQSDKFAEKFPNWIYKRLKEKKLQGKHNLYRERDVLATARYLLTHHSIRMDRLVVPKRIGLRGETTTEFKQNHQNYRWVGEFRPHRIAKKVLDSVRVVKLCEHCHHEIHIYPMDLDGNVDMSQSRPMFERLEKVVYYRVDRKADDRGRSKGIIVDEISDYDNSVPINIHAGYQPRTSDDSVSYRPVLSNTGEYDPFDHEMYSWGA